MQTRFQYIAGGGSVLLCLLVMGGAQAQSASAPKRKPPIERAREFLQARGTHLYRGKFKFRNVGANLPDLFERFLRGDAEGAKQTLRRASEEGVRCVRCFGTTWGPADFGLFLQDRPRWFRAYDQMLAEADAVGITVIPSLLFNIRMLPEFVRQTQGGQEDVVDYLTPGSASNRLAVEYVTAIVSRYRRDPRVLFWEIGNEYNLEADLSLQWKRRPLNQVPTSEQIRTFLVQIATLIKRLDRQHLVTSGNADMRPAAWHLREAYRKHQAARQKGETATEGLDYPMDWTKDTWQQYQEMLEFLNPAPLDVVSVHLYPPGEETPSWLMRDDDHALVVSWAQRAADGMGKPLFVGEFGARVFADGKELEGRWMRDFLRRMQEEAAPLSAFWSWEFDPQNPSQAPYSLSVERTPNFVRLLKEANTVLQEAVLRDAATGRR